MNLSQTTSRKVGQQPCPSLSHTAVGHPLTCANVPNRRLSQTKTWDTQNTPDFPCNPSVPTCPLLRREALKPAPAPPYTTSRAHNPKENSHE